MRPPSTGDGEIIREVQTLCANIHASGKEWTNEDAIAVAALFRQSPNPFALFRFVDEKTGHTSVGYRTRDGREWFHILRQMRNSRDCPLLDEITAVKS